MKPPRPIDWTGRRRRCAAVWLALLVGVSFASGGGAQEPEPAARAGLWIAHRATLEGVELVLANAPRLAGRVVDQSGLPVAGLRFRLDPVWDGEGTTAVTDEEGRFDVRLLTDSPHRALFADPWFETRRAPVDAAWAAGRKDIEIVLRRRPVVRLFVTDAATGAPLERFGVATRPGLDNPAIRSDVQTGFEVRGFETHPGGVVVRPFYPGDGFKIGAPGYLTQEGEIPPATGEVIELRVALQPSARARGRVLREGRPLAGATVHVLHGRLHRVVPGMRVEGLQDGIGSPPRPEPRDGAFVTGRRREASTTRTDGEGRFELALPSGAHLVEVPAVDGHALRLAPFETSASEIVELGDLRLVSCAAITGRVLLPPTLQPRDIALDLNATGRDQVAKIDDQGRFALEGIAPGGHELNVRGSRERLAAVPPRALELGPGQRLELELDLRDYGMCELAVQLEAPGLELGSTFLGLSFRPLDAGAEPAHFGDFVQGGAFRGPTRACGQARVSLRTLSGLDVEHPSAVLFLEAGTRVEERLRFPVGRLVVRLPDGLGLSTNGGFTIRLRPLPARPGQEETVLRGWYYGSTEPSTGSIADPAAGRFGFQLAPAGRFALSFRLEDHRAPLELLGTDDQGQPIRGRPARFVSEAEVLVPEGGELEVRLP